MQILTMLMFFLLVSSGPVYHEGCDCPQLDGSVWFSQMHCPHSFPQIEQDMSQFASVDPDRNAQEIPQRFGQRQSLCHYTIKDNKVYYYIARLGFNIKVPDFFSKVYVHS